MSDVHAVTAEKRHTVRVAGWAYIVVGLIFVGHRIALGATMVGRLFAAHPQAGQATPVQSLMIVAVFSLMPLALGALLIGGAVYFFRLRESGRLALIITSCALAGVGLVRALSATLTLVMARLVSSPRTPHAFGGDAQREVVNMVSSLVLAIVLIVLVVVITRPGVRDCMLPPQRPTVPVPLPVPPAAGQ